VCGRFTLTIDIEGLLERFPFDVGPLTYQPRFNIAPTQQVLVYGAQGPRTAEHMRWGLVPSWAKDLSIGHRMINARAETLTARSSFRTPLRTHRCLVLADGFYEWKREGVARTPMLVKLKAGEPFGFAGLWAEWRDPASRRQVRSCTIITTGANKLMAPIHARMPVIISRETEEAWLDPDVEDPSLLLSLLTPYPSESMGAYAVSSTVNSVHNEDPDCVLPV